MGLTLWEEASLEADNSELLCGMDRARRWTLVALVGQADGTETARKLRVGRFGDLSVLLSRLGRLGGERLLLRTGSDHLEHVVSSTGARGAGQEINISVGIIVQVVW